MERWLNILAALLAIFVFVTGIASWSELMKGCDSNKDAKRSITLLAGQSYSFHNAQITASGGDIAVAGPPWKLSASGGILHLGGHDPGDVPKYDGLKGNYRATLDVRSGQWYAVFAADLTTYAKIRVVDCGGQSRSLVLEQIYPARCAGTK